jgi:hypothetical protein
LENIDEGTVHSEQNVTQNMPIPKEVNGFPKMQPALQKAETEDAGSGV